MSLSGVRDAMCGSVTKICTGVDGLGATMQCFKLKKSQCAHHPGLWEEQSVSSQN